MAFSRLLQKGDACVQIALLHGTQRYKKGFFLATTSDQKIRYFVQFEEIVDILVVNVLCSVQK